MLLLGEPRAEEFLGTNFRRYRAEKAFSNLEDHHSISLGHGHSYGMVCKAQATVKAESCWLPPRGFSGCILSCAWRMLHTELSTRHTTGLRRRGMGLERLNGRREGVLRCLRMKPTCSAPQIWRPCQICWHNWAIAHPFLTRQVDVRSAS
jgi:hypothetical protein